MARLKFLLASGEISPGGALAPVLAPFGLDLPRLARELNEQSLRRFPRGFPVAIRLVVGEGGSYRVTVGRPSLGHYLRFLAVGDALPLEVAYSLVRLFAADRSPVAAPQPTAAMLLATLGSFRRPPPIGGL